MLVMPAHPTRQHSPTIGVSDRPRRVRNRSVGHFSEERSRGWPLARSEQPPRLWPASTRWRLIPTHRWPVRRPREQLEGHIRSHWIPIPRSPPRRAIGEITGPVLTAVSTDAAQSRSDPRQLRAEALPGATPMRGCLRRLPAYQRRAPRRNDGSCRVLTGLLSEPFVAPWACGGRRRLPRGVAVRIDCARDRITARGGVSSIARLW